MVVRDVRAGEDLARSGPDEVFDRPDLVEPEAAVEPECPREDQCGAEDDVRADRDTTHHITRQRMSVRSTRSPSAEVSFLPSSRVRAW
jgi:hypothetical protein